MWGKSVINMEISNKRASLDIVFTNKHEGGAVIRAGVPIRRYTVCAQQADVVIIVRYCQVRSPYLNMCIMRKVPSSI